MKRKNLEHIIRAAGACASLDSLYIMGSQAILGEHPELDSVGMLGSQNYNFKLKEITESILLVSEEADVLVPEDYRKAEMIEGAIGENSLFHENFGYYAQAIDETTCKLPDGWRKRLIPICNEGTNGVTGYCLETHDIIISKLVAGREKDIRYFQAACSLKILSKDKLLSRLDSTQNISDNDRERVRAVIQREITNELSREIG